MRTKVYVATSFRIPQIGGVSTHIETLIPCLRDSGMLAGMQTDSWSYPIKPVRGCVRVWNMLTGGLQGIHWMKCSMRHLGQMFNPRDAGILHCHDAICAVALGDQARRRGMKVVCTVHAPASRHVLENTGGRDREMSLFLDSIERRAWEYVDRFIAVDTGQSQILQEHGVAEERISVIYNAVDLNEVEREKPAGDIATTQGGHILVARRLAPKNGVEFAIRAAAIADPRLRYLIAGDGGKRQDLETLAASMGVRDRVSFLGNVSHEQVLRLTWGALCCLVPSVPCYGVVEATSISAIEAMACGKIVIASNIGGLREIITHGATGILVPPGDPKALAEAIDAIARHEGVRRSIGRQARRFAESRLSTGPWFSKHLEVYESALEQERAQ